MYMYIYIYIPRCEQEETLAGAFTCNRRPDKETRLSCRLNDNRKREREREGGMELQIIRAHLRDSHFQGCFAGGAGLNAARIRGEPL